MVNKCTRTTISPLYDACNAIVEWRITSLTMSFRRNLLTALSIILCMLVGNVAIAQSYCTPSYYYSSPCYSQNITNVYVKGYGSSVLNDATSTCTSSGYTDQTATSGDTVALQQGSVDSASLTSSIYYDNGWVAWIDFNDDGVFADSEVVAGPFYSSSYPYYTLSYKINIPITANTGFHRMRIRLAYTYGLPKNSSGTPHMDPCKNGSYCYSSGSSLYCGYYYYYGASRDYTVQIVAAPACSGTPSVAITNSSSQTLCSGSYDTLNATLPASTGLTYQWQSSSDGGITWSNISSANATQYIDTVSGTSGNLQFRVKVTCSSSGMSGYSNTDTVNIKAASDCYCTPKTYYSYFYYYSIYSVRLGAENVAGSVTDNYFSYSGSGYEDRTSVIAPDTVNPGKSYQDSVEVYYPYDQGLSCWVDFNDNGTFESSEQMWSTYYSCCSSPTWWTGTFSVPTSAPGGNHRMRIRDVYYCCSTPSSYDPCTYSTSGGSYYYYGDAHDYLVYVQSPVGTPTLSKTNVSLCTGGSATLSASDTTAGVTYSWSGPAGYSATGSSVTISSATYASNGVYSVRASKTVSGVTYTSAAAYDTVTVYITPVHTSYGSNTPVCSGNMLMLYDTTLPTKGVTYSWTGPASFSSSSQDTVIYNAQTTNGGIYTVTANNNGCTSSKSTSVTVYQTPSITSLSSVNPTSCSPANGSITINGLNASTRYTIYYTYNGTLVGPLSLTTNASGQITISGLNTGLYNNFTATLNNCPSAPMGPVTLSNSSTPAAPSASSNAPLCFNSTLKLTASSTASGVTYTWNGPSSFSSSSSSPTISSIPFADSGTYNVYVTNASGCASSSTAVYVQVKPLPLNPKSGSNSPICSGPALNLTANDSTSGVTYSWTGPVGFTSTLQNPTINPTTPSNAGIYTVYAILNGCSSVLPAYDTVVVKKTPSNPTASGNSPVCQGPLYAIYLYANSDSGAVYTWSGPAGTITTQNPVISNPPFSDSGTYTVSVTLAGCPALSSAATHISILATPSSPSVATPAFTYCQFSPTVILSATPASSSDTLLWYDIPVGGIGSDTAITPQDSIPGIFKYYVAEKAPDGCVGQRILQTVTIKELPARPYVPAATYNYCQGQPATILSAIGTNLLWYTDSVSTTGGSTYAPIPSTAAPGIYYYYVSQTVNGCESKRTQITVNVTAKPGEPGGPSVITFCQNDNATPLTAVGANLLWYSDPSGGIGSDIAPTPVTSYPNDTFRIYVTQTVNGCESDRKPITVIIKERPNVLIVGSQPYVCQYDTMQFSYYGSATSLASFEWGLPTGATIVSGSGIGPLIVRFDSAGKLPVTLLVNDNGCTSDLSTYTVDVRMAPTIPVSSAGDACVGQPVLVQTGIANENIQQYNWDFAGGTVAYGTTGPGPYGVVFPQQGTYIVSLVALTNECPSLRITDTINVHPKGDAHIAYVSASTICAGDSVNFKVENPNPAFTYQWSPANFFGLQNNSGDVYGYIDVSSTITLKVTTEFGCVSMDSVQIRSQSCCTINFPNAFSPNGDGKNDIFRPLPGTGHRSIKKFVVVDRWGQTMFETANEGIGWDGTAHGVPQDIGTYYWSITYDCADGKTYHESGQVILVK